MRTFRLDLEGFDIQLTINEQFGIVITVEDGKVKSVVQLVDQFRKLDVMTVDEYIKRLEQVCFKEVA